MVISMVSMVVSGVVRVILVSLKNVFSSVCMMIVNVGGRDIVWCLMSGDKR